jgi:hypothetical protein
VSRTSRWSRVRLGWRLAQRLWSAQPEERLDRRV